MKKPTGLLHWIDEHLLKWLLVGFIYIIPLYPKIPLIRMVDTFVHIRMEDVYIAIITLFFFIQLIRRKVKIEKKFLIPIVIFWVAVFTSFIVANFIQKTIPPHVIEVSLLHSLRRVEYMVIFFIAFAAIKSKRDFYFYMKHILVALTLVAVYAVGQKVFGWCAFQTMNPEFAKGYCLTLSADARVSSTFAGHYDLAAYLTLLIPVVLGLYIYLKKPIYFVPFVVAILTMVLTASRASYGAYILSTVPFLLLRRKFKLLLIAIILTVAFTPLSDGLTSRIQRSFMATQIYVDPVTGETVVPQDQQQLPAGTIRNTTDVKSIDASKIDTTLDPESAKQAKEQLRKKIQEDAQRKGLFLTEDQISAQVNDLFSSYIPVKEVLPDISQSVRYAISWPRAISAFMFNPITGKGPYSLGEATDGDYFRWLGEFGLFGTLSFLAIFFIIGKHILQNMKKFSQDEQNVFYGFFFGIVGLLINATYIDVFEASKVAYHVWLLAGLCVAIMSFDKKELQEEHSTVKETKPNA